MKVFIDELFGPAETFVVSRLINAAAESVFVFGTPVDATTSVLKLYSKLDVERRQPECRQERVERLRGSRW